MIFFIVQRELWIAIAYASFMQCYVRFCNYLLHSCMICMIVLKASADMTVYHNGHTYIVWGRQVASSVGAMDWQLPAPLQ